MKKSVKKEVKKKKMFSFEEFTVLDMFLTKLAVFSFTLWLVGILSINFLEFVIQNSFLFFLIFLLASIKPLSRLLKK